MPKNNDVANIALKTMHNDILKSNPNATLTTKKMRVVLREKFNDIHARNASWMFTQSQYDVVRSHFDDAYRAKIERASKRNAKASTSKAPRKSRVVRDDKANVDAVVINNELQDA